MNIIKIFRVQQLLLLYSLTISVLPDCYASELTGAEILNSFKNRDGFLKSEIPKLATFKMVTHASMFDPNQGQMLKDCAVTWEGDNVKMKIVYDYLHDPVYVPPGTGRYAYQSIDYDKDRRLIVWRYLETYIISTSEKTEVLDKLQRLNVSPDGSIEKAESISTAKHVYHTKSGISSGEFKYFLLASGLGFSDFIEANDINLAKLPDTKFIEVNSRGNFGKDSKGIWKLDVDPNSDFFVRNASYTFDGMNRPSKVVSTSDIVKKNGLEYAREGRIVFSDSTVRDYMNIDISIADNKQLRQEVERIMGSPLPSGSEIIDFNEGKPTRMKIK
ncbi:MAG: hypothetical protein PHQ35_11390 [Phycisphaerae bacterium]|nr:hypothetical protein [Phycisphaerae bacterium]MDD5382026.1 hypothetical protein [Phycisphaerae bacterium]